MFHKINLKTFRLGLTESIAKLKKGHLYKLDIVARPSKKLGLEWNLLKIKNM
jgi:hypothetical protein